jgi:hypothetical protein
VLSLLWRCLHRPAAEPSNPALRYGCAGRSEDKLRHFTSTPFHQMLPLEMQNNLRHTCRIKWMRPPQEGKYHD